jgi:hypothetical protein
MKDDPFRRTVALFHQSREARRQGFDFLRLVKADHAPSLALQTHLLGVTM